MKLKPLSDCIVVEQDEEKVSSIIIVPGTKKLFSGIVRAIGPGKKLENGKVSAMDVDVGDHVMFGEYTGQVTEIEGKQYLMMRNAEVIGILNE
jgi:chaperonin GroES